MAKERLVKEFRSCSPTNGCFPGRASLTIVALEIGDSGLGIAEQTASYQITSKLQIRRNSLRFSLHGRIVQDEVDLGLHAGKIALDLLQGLAAAFYVGKPPFQDIECGCFRLAECPRFPRILQILFKRGNLPLQADGRIISAGSEQVEPGNEQLGVDPL